MDVVHTALDWKWDLLRERTLCIEVSERATANEVNSDPVSHFLV